MATILTTIRHALHGRYNVRIIHQWIDGTWAAIEWEDLNGTNYAGIRGPNGSITMVPLGDNYLMRVGGSVMHTTPCSNGICWAS